MIPQAAITAWRHHAPWSGSDQVEHDLVLSRAICELYQQPALANALIFRGGTALHKLFLPHAGRFSEDLDFVQVQAEPIGATVDAIHQCLDHWLGQPNWKQGPNRFTLQYRFATEMEPIVTRKVKIEINTREHHHVQPYQKKPFQIMNPWFEGECEVLTYSLEELLATKFRALYQRKKGRDLYDLWYVLQTVPNIDLDQIVTIFKHYMRYETVPKRAEIEKNLNNKQHDPVFNQDIKPLLTNEQVSHYQTADAFQFIHQQLVQRLE